MPESEGKGLAVVTGASTGIGRELARCCADDGYDLIIAANETGIEETASMIRDMGAQVETVNADLGTPEGVETFWKSVKDRDVALFLANAGIGLGHAFLEQQFDDIERVIDLNILGTTRLLHLCGRKMQAQGDGRILVTGSIAGFMPGSYQAVYNATKAYLDSLSYALRNEMKNTGVSVTCLMPGPTETEFFDRADMEGTSVGKDHSKDDAAMVARKGYDAMMKGQSGVVTGFMNKVQSTFAGLIPDTLLAKMHRRMAEPEDSRS